MKKINSTIAVVFTLMFLLLSCYKEDKITSEKGEPNYKIEDSSDPLDHYRYQFFRSTGVYLLYEYNEVDYSWDMSSISSSTLEKQVHRDTLMMGVSYLEKTLLNYYNDDFKKSYFPLKIMLAREVNDNRYESQLYDDRICNYGRNYLAIGRIKTGIDLLTDEQIIAAKGDINGILWAYIIYKNNLLSISNDFFAPTAEMYNMSLTNDSQRDEPDYVKKKGFWSYDKYNLGNDYMLPNETKDIYDFVYMITTHTAQEMSALMKGYETLKVKYDALVGVLKANYGIDIQKIGDAGIKNNKL